MILYGLSELKDMNLHLAYNLIIDILLGIDESAALMS